MTAYGSEASVRVLSGVQDPPITSGDISALMVFSDAQITRDIGAYGGEDIPTEIEELSNLLTCIKLYNRPDLRFRLGSQGITEQQIEKALARWEAQVARLYAYFGASLEVPETVTDVDVAFRVADSE